jgi:hypothetical protein
LIAQSLACWQLVSTPLESAGGLVASGSLVEGGGDEAQLAMSSAMRQRVARITQR